MTNKATVTFDSLPAEVANLSRKIDMILSIVSPGLHIEKRDRKLTVEELQEYLPEKPARQTIYQKVNERKIPFEKHGRRLYFSKSAIDEWLENGRQI